ncbi:MAG: 5'/3'-nucleotidase SurE [Chloroflexota bacterium]
MRLLISNDDGIHSPGLAVLAKVAAKFGEVMVVAPETEQSSTSHSISSSRPLRYEKTDSVGGADAYKVNGTPADCVTVGLYHWQADVVLAGINQGTNLGNGMWHSGTLAAAHQATLLGARGIAVSTLKSGLSEHLRELEPNVERVLRVLLPRTELRFVNVNVPPKPRGIRWVRQAVEQYDGEIVPANDPYKRPIFWLAVTKLKKHATETDLWAFEQGYITVTPLAIDMTDRALLPEPGEEGSVTEFKRPPEQATRVRLDADGLSLQEKKSK